MENQTFIKYLESLQNSNKDKRRRDMQIFAAAVAFLVVVIIMWGFFDARSQVPWPENRVPEFNKAAFNSARQDYGKEKNILLFDSSRQQALIREYISQSTDWNLRGFVRHLNTELNGKICLIRSGRHMKMSAVNKELISKKEAELEKIIREKEAALDKASYWDNTYQMRRELRAAKIARDGMQDFETGLAKIYIAIRLEYPYSGTFLEPAFAVARITGADIRGDFRLHFSMNSARPVLSTSFMKKLGALVTDSLKNKIAVTEKNLKTIKEEAFRNFSRHRDQVVKEIKAQIAPRRAEVRENFYTKWFSILLMTMMSLLMFLFLKWYFIIIRRKGIAKKTTHEIYLATNVTSWLLRIMALIVVVLGMAVLVANVVVAVQGRSLCTGFDFFRRINLLYGLLSPLWITLMTLMGSWLLVLQSEFICFVSNVYHVMFMKAHKK